MAAETILSATDETALLSMTTHPSNGALQQLISDHHDYHEKAHGRLREDVNGIGRKVDSFQLVQTDILLRIQKIELTPVNVDKVNFSSKQLIAIVVVAFGLGGGMWRLQVGIDDVHTAITSAAALQNERTASQEKQLTDVKAELQLRRIEIQNLSNKLSDFMLQKGQIMAEQEECCVLGVCCEPTLAQRTLADQLSAEIPSLHGHAAQDVAAFIRSHYDLAPKGLFQPLMDYIAAEAREYPYRQS